MPNFKFLQFPLKSQLFFCVQKMETLCTLTVSMEILCTVLKWVQSEQTNEFLQNYVNIHQESKPNCISMIKYTKHEVQSKSKSRRSKSNPQ